LEIFVQFFYQRYRNIYVKVKYFLLLVCTKDGNCLVLAADADGAVGNRRWQIYSRETPSMHARTELKNRLAMIFELAP